VDLTLDSASQTVLGDVGPEGGAVVVEVPLSRIGRALVVLLEEPNHTSLPFGKPHYPTIKNKIELTPIRSNTTREGIRH